jgi:hypothetical protein
MALLREIERYLKTSGMKPTVFGRNAVRDPRLVHDLRRGREPGTRLAARVRDFITTGAAR